MLFLYNQISGCLFILKLLISPLGWDSHLTVELFIMMHIEWLMSSSELQNRWDCFETWATWISNGLPANVTFMDAQDTTAEAMNNVESDLQLLSN